MEHAAVRLYQLFKAQHYAEFAGNLSALVQLPYSSLSNLRRSCTYTVQLLFYYTELPCASYAPYVLTSCQYGPAQHHSQHHRGSSARK
jgi:hypothetical protein